MNGGELAALLVAVLGLAIGIVPGLWFGARGQPRTAGHVVLTIIVALFAIGGLGLYTIGGPSEELFTRLVILPLSLPIALLAAAVLVGIPMYASYLLAHRIGFWITGRTRPYEQTNEPDQQ